MGGRVGTSRESAQASRDVRDELDEHLAAINENTAEVASVHEEVGELEARLAKLAERVDALQALVLAQTRERIPAHPPVDARTRPVRLTANEESVVRALADADAPLAAAIIGSRAGLTPELAGQVLSRLVHKGVPLVVRVERGAHTYALEEGFRAEKSDSFSFKK